MKQMKRVLAAVIVVLLCVAQATPQVALAAWNPNVAVHVEPKLIENSTLAVGTHLIHLSAMSDKLYEEALTTASDSGQKTVYYKSELAEGEWFNVTTATKIDDIGADGMSVDSRAIEALYFTYHTKSDGVTYDLRTNQAVNPFDIPSPYIIYELEELVPLKDEYEYLAEMGSNNTGYYKRVTKFYSDADTWVLANPEVKVFDSELSYLDKYTKYLRENEAAPNELDAVQQVMEHLDASRRSIIFTYLEPELEVLNTDLAAQLLAVPDKLPKAVTNCKANVKKSDAKCRAKIANNGDSVISAYRYGLYNEMATSDAFEKADVVLAKLLTLGQIETSTIASRLVELAMLENDLTPSATVGYLQRLRGGENSDYRTAVSAEATEQQLLAIAEIDRILVCSIQTELEFLLTEMVNRLDNTAGLALLDARLVDARGYYDLVPLGGFKLGSDESVAAHIVFLQRLRNEVLSRSSEQDQLVAGKSDLEGQLQSALGDNDLIGANALKGKISELDAKLGRHNDNLKAETDDLNSKRAGGDGDQSLDDQLDAAMAGMDSGAGKLAGDLRRSGLDAIDKGDQSGLDSSLDGLLDMMNTNQGLALPAITSLHDAMVNKRDVDGNKSFGSQIDKSAKAVDGAGKGGLTAEQLKRLADWADQLLRDGNPYIYIRYNDGGNEYIPCQVLCHYTGMRYIWQQNERTGTITKKGQYYSFTIDSTKVARDKDGIKTEQMAIVAKWQDAVHLHESYTIAKFKAEAYYIPGTKYGVLLTDEMRAMLAEILGTA